MRVRRGVLAALVAVLVCACGAWGQSAESLLQAMRWRNVGPAVFAGRVVDVEALDNDFRYVITASASGGVWKSTNAGTTWTPIFDQYKSASIGDVAIFQKNPNIIWVGTGEANNRNSVAWGDGIYKSTDGGKTFARSGLADTFQVSRIVTHPTDANIVYAAAIGALWGPSGDRGLFKTVDGGKTWTKLTSGLPDTKAGEVKSGAIDVVMDPVDANTLYVAFYQRLRRPWRFDSGGPNGGIFKSIDAGRTWTKLSAGLPSGPTGRIGLAIYRKNPRIVMAMIEHGNRPAPDSPDYADMTKLGTGVYRSEDAGRTWRQVNRYNNRPFYYSQIRINPTDDKKVYLLTTNFMISEDGGRTFKPAPTSYEGGLDFHGMWIDPNNGERFYIGKDKGLTLTHDDGASFILFDNMPIAQFYAVGVDMRDPYYVYGGTQDNGTWGGPHFSRDVRGTLNDSWWKLHWGDGMFIQIDPTNWRQVYTEAENASVRRYDALTREVESSRTVTNLRDYVPAGTTGTARQGWPVGLRFNWRAPLVMSPHDPQTLYVGGNHVLRTTDGARTWTIISPDLSTNDRVKTDPNSGGLTPDTSGAETHCTVVALAESPQTRGVIWAGTDDGNVQVTRDGGKTWSNVRGNISGVPAGIWVSSVEASHFDEGTAYVTFDGHRSDALTTWVFKTTDYGQTWTNIANNLPTNEPLYVVREDVKNRDLLFVGSEFAVHASLDGGKRWHKLGDGMPTVATHDLVIHPRDGDLIAATHGRGFYVLDDITPLQQWNEKLAGAKAHLFEQRTATIWNDQSRGGARGHLLWAAENPPYIVKPAEGAEVRGRLQSGALISYYIGANGGSAKPLLEVSDASGQRKRTIAAEMKPGIHRALWDLRFDATAQQIERFKVAFARAVERANRAPGTSAAQKSLLAQATKEMVAAMDDLAINAIVARLLEAFDTDAEAGPPPFQYLRGDAAPAGEYTVTLRVGGATQSTKLTVRRDPNQ